MMLKSAEDIVSWSLKLDCCEIARAINMILALERKSMYSLFVS